MFERQYRLMDAATDAGAAGAAAGGAASTPSPAGSATATPPPPSAGSLLSQGGGEHDWLPEKFRVFGEDKSLDVLASAKKLAAEGYGPLEKRMGSGDMPPKTPEDYDIKQLPEGVKLEDLKKDEKFNGFLKAAHAKGITNAQIEFVLGEYFSRAQAMAEAKETQTMEAAQAALREVWKDDAAFSGNVKLAFKAASAVAAKAGVSIEDIESAGLGNNATFLRIMAAIGPEIGETPGGGLPNSAQSTTAAEDIKLLMTKLMDPKLTNDPERPVWQRKVNEYYNRMPGGTTPVY